MSQRAAEVSCYAGYRADQEPRAFVVDGVAHEVAAILRRWREPDLDAFVVRTREGLTYELRLDRARDHWTAAPR